MRASFVSTGIATAVIFASVPAFAAPPGDEPPAQAPTGASQPPADGDATAGDPPEGEPPEGELKPSPEQQAMELFRQGEDAYGQADYEVALEHFQDAQSLYPSAVFHYNIGQCYEALEKLEQAITSYKAYLRSNPEDRANVERKVEMLEKLVEAGDTPAPQPEPEPEPDDRKKGFPPGVLIGTGAASLVLGGVAFGLGAGLFAPQAASLSAELGEVNQQTGANPQLLTRDEAADIARRGQTAEVLQGVFMGVGGALLVIGAAELVSGVVLARKKKAREAQTAKVQAAPIFSTTGAGISLTGRF